jgi:hypothetical protein
MGEQYLACAFTIPTGMSAGISCKAAVLATTVSACYTGGPALSKAMERYRTPQEKVEKEREHPLLQAALAYAKEGWPVFPVQCPIKGHCSCGRPDCSSPAKHPLTRNGLKDATIDEARIRSFWRCFSTANIGIATGKLSPEAQQSGLLVLDVDPRHGGNASLSMLTQMHNRLPFTRLVLTGGGGRHYYFTTDEELRSTVDLCGLSGLDVRASGGYVIAPPSRHISGTRYRFARPEVPVAPLPEWLASSMRPPQEGQLRHHRGLGYSGETASTTAEDLLVQALQRAIPGNRNNTGFILACRLRDQGVEPWEAEAILRDFAAKTPQHNTRYTVYEALASVKQAYKRKPSKSRERRVICGKSRGTKYSS